VNCYRYLDKLPKVPLSLLREISDYAPEHREYVSVIDRVMTDKNANVPNLMYRRWTITPALTEWLKHNISDQLDKVGVQMSSPYNGSGVHLPHTDSHPRRWVLNYIVELGGDNVLTSFYKEKGHPLVREHLTRPESYDDLELVEQFKAEPGRWWVLNAQIIHDAINITGNRISITCAISADNPLSVLKGYENEQY